jgi:hypothetical protein
LFRKNLRVAAVVAAQVTTEFEMYEEVFKEKFEGVVPAGVEVLWVPPKATTIGRLPDDVSPLPAKVIKGYSNGIVELLVFPGLDRFTSCQHISSKGLKNPTGGPSEVAKRQGAWMFNPMFDAMYNDSIRESDPSRESSLVDAPKGRSRRAPQLQAAE